MLGFIYFSNYMQIMGCARASVTALQLRIDSNIPNKVDVCSSSSFYIAANEMIKESPLLYCEVMNLFSLMHNSLSPEF